MRENQAELEPLLQYIDRRGPSDLPHADLHPRQAGRRHARAGPRRRPIRRAVALARFALRIGHALERRHPRHPGTRAPRDQPAALRVHRPAGARRRLRVALPRRRARVRRLRDRRPVRLRADRRQARQRARSRATTSRASATATPPPRSSPRRRAKQCRCTHECNTRTMLLFDRRKAVPVDLQRARPQEAARLTARVRRRAPPRSRPSAARASAGAPRRPRARRRRAARRCTPARSTRSACD